VPRIGDRRADVHQGSIRVDSISRYTHWRRNRVHPW
jgi:hypothetical protein